MDCKRCGKMLPDGATVCSACGTVNGSIREAVEPGTKYGRYSQDSFGEPSSYWQSSGANASSGSDHMPPPPGSDHAAFYQTIPVSSSQQGHAGVSHQNESALLVEFILSLVGIFGVGWLMAGETVPGRLLLICSFLVYWPIMIAGTILTFGLGLICLGPIAIGAILLNILLLNRVVKRKANHFAASPPPSYTHSTRF